ncbi:MAG: iron-containing alcohol dehydrogenase [Syntrophaceae bacterium]
MLLPSNYEFSCPVKINSGNKALEHLPFELDILNARKPFVITSKDAADRGLVNVIIDAFKDSGLTIGIFDGVPPSPDVTLIRELFSLYRDRGYDAVIALGGGAVTDTAKALNIVVSGEPEDLERCAGDNLITKHLNPFISVQTLSGTGYETTRYAFFGGRAYASHFLMPDLVVIDPRMTISEDTMVTAASTLVALTHSVEAYVSTGKNPLADSYAFPAIRFIMENLANVIRNPSDKKGCLTLANAHCMAGCAFSNIEAGMAHKLGKVIGDASHVPHGICMGILLPHILESQLSESSDNIKELLLPLAGFDAYAETSENSRTQKAISVLYDFLQDLVAASGGVIATSLRDAGVSKEILEDMRKKTIDNSLGIVDMDGYLKILEQAWEGK